MHCNFRQYKTKSISREIIKTVQLLFSWFNVVKFVYKTIPSKIATILEKFI